MQAFEKAGDLGAAAASGRGGGAEEAKAQRAIPQALQEVFAAEDGRKAGPVGGRRGIERTRRPPVMPREFVGMRDRHVQDLCNLRDGQQARVFDSGRLALSALSGTIPRGQPRRGASLKCRQRRHDCGQTLDRQSVDRVHRRQRKQPFQSVMMGGFDTPWTSWSFPSAHGGHDAAAQRDCQGVRVARRTRPSSSLPKPTSFGLLPWPANLAEI